MSWLSANAKGKRVLMLESVRDVGNIGTIIRSARAFGIDLLVISTDCADLYNPKTIRASMGALFTQRIVVLESISSAAFALRSNGSRVYAAALVRDAKKLGEIELKMGDAILIGNEGHGLSQESVNACDECVYIPMEAGSESLNASIAASICMWELYKIN
jgi:TrmH family RNA methyltransferase